MTAHFVHVGRVQRVASTTKFMLAISLWLSFDIGHLVYAYGSLGHYVIGETVSLTLKNTTIENMNTCGFLAPFNNSMGLASNWADIIKGNPVYRWTSPFHYYDIDNDPPSYCGLFTKPTSNRTLNLYNGVRRALNNHTCKADICCGSKFNNGMLLHLLQDIYQPLHLTGKSRGGNEEHFIKDGKNYNLHKFWDTNVLEMLMTDVFSVNFTRENAVVYFHEKITIDYDKLPENNCPIYHKEYERNKGINLMRYVFNKTQNVLEENCDIVWHTERDDYIQEAKKQVEKLMVQSVVTLNCVLEYIYG